jgi:hypothetical protein
VSVTLFVGDCTEHLATTAKRFDPSAYLVEFSNYKSFLNSAGPDITAYTSGADLPKITNTECVFYQVLNRADKIFFCSPEVWSDHTDEFSITSLKQITEYFLYLVQKEKNNVEGLDLSEYATSTYLNLLDTRKSITQPQFWVAGCSITAGVGIDPTQRFSVKISEYFGLPFSDLSQGGSSIEFAADQILRSDIRAGDIVLWGLTSEYRATVWDRKSSEPKTFTPFRFDMKTNQADNIVDETRLYKALTSVCAVENYCDKIGANLVAVPILCSETLQLLLHKNKCYHQIPYMPGYLDLGTDNLHPGQKQHQWYADQLINIIKTRSVMPQDNHATL